MEALREVLRRDVEAGARALLGCILVRGDMAAQIVETEAYTWDDPGCHAYRKERMKNMAMYGRAGTAYIYFTYGNHWMLNVVADQDDVPGAVLIRAAKPLSGLETFYSNRPNISVEKDLLSGPGKLAKAFGIDNQYNSIDLLSPASEVQILQAQSKPIVGISRRIGLAVGKGEEAMRRYIDINLIDWITPHGLNRTILGDKGAE
ncbi:MAG: DNA-3-methyladenine glycosylase [Armatimonadetes bacterium]|nr:DNA-3-methyladenine glycosylase [Armatimonadota bacterium]